MRFTTLVLTIITLIFLNGSLFAEEFYLDSPYNTAAFRFEIDNDAVWDKDSNFTNGWRLATSARNTDMACVLTSGSISESITPS
jgi:hypothetical protein